MGNLDDIDSWRVRLGDKGTADLAASLRSEIYDLGHERWFDLGRSGSPVAAAIRRRHPRYGDELLILKFLDKRVDDKHRSLRLAWDDSPKSFRTRHLARVLEPPLVVGAGRGVFMRVADGDLTSCRPLTDLMYEDDSVAVRCAKIMSSVLGEWNGRRRNAPDTTVGDFIGTIVGDRRDDVVEWARQRKTTAGEADPLDLLTGIHAKLPVRCLLVGRAHGDLSGRNILVPFDPAADTGRYVLIDYDHFASDAPLARDPMHLLVALALDHFDDLTPGPRCRLINVLVDPDGSPAGPVARFREVSSAIRCKGKEFAERGGFGEYWTQQSLLSLVGAGLVHLGRTLQVTQAEQAKQWCYDLAAAAAERFLRLAKPAVPARGSAIRADRTRPPHAPRRGSRMLDRDQESTQLRRRLTAGPHGVAILRGARGIGKSLLVNTVLGHLGENTPTIHSYHATAGCRLDLKTLTELLEAGRPGTLGAGSRPGPASLVRLQQSLADLGDRPVVITIDSAENLLDPRTRRLADIELDAALDLIASEPDHRATLLLVTQHDLASPDHRAWPDAWPPIQLDGLPCDEFVDYLCSRDLHGRLGLDDLSPRQRRGLWQCLQGNPRHAELFCAAATESEEVDVPTFCEGPWPGLPGELPRTLVRRLLGGLNPVRVGVMQALAAAGTSVGADTVAAIIDRRPTPDHIAKALAALADQGVVYRTAGATQYLLPPDDAEVVLDRLTEKEGAAAVSDLLQRAANALTPLRARTPGNLSDLRFHFAELEALLRAGVHGSAYEVIESIDRVLGPWNSRFLLLRQRETVRGELDDAHSEMSNDNALADIYRSRAQFPEAEATFRRALTRAEELHDPRSRMKVSLNLASMCWETSKTDSAICRYEAILREARQHGDRLAWMGALDGLASCHRRRGQFDQALRLANQALSAPSLPGFPDPEQGSILSMSVVVNLARWYAECNRMEDATRMVSIAYEAVRERGDDSFVAACLNVEADVLFYRERYDDAAVRAAEAVVKAHAVQDPAVLLQARTTLSMIRLHEGRLDEAWREIRRAQPHRREGRSLIVLALSALAIHRYDRSAARRYFAQLCGEAELRLDHDHDGHDVGARGMLAFALSGLHLDDTRDLSTVEAQARRARDESQPAPPLEERLIFLVNQLDRLGPRPGRLQPVVHALRRT